MIQPFLNFIKIVLETLRYQLCLLDYIVYQRDYLSSSFYPNDKHAKVHCYSTYLMIKFITNPLYTQQKHYRSPTFLDDMKANLKNVAIPGTGIALSYFVLTKPFLYFFVLLFVPFVCFLGSINQCYQDFLAFNDSNQNNPFNWSENMFKHYYDNLLTSRNWFTLWRYNTHLVTYHSYLTHSIDYQMEDKWKFLKEGKELGIPVSPFFDNIESIVCKNILIEGGMGIHFYKNAYFGGNYIIQEKLANAHWLNELLPKNAPLSTMRIITTSVYPLSKDYSEKKIQRLLTEELSLQAREENENRALGQDTSAEATRTTAHHAKNSSFSSYTTDDEGWKIAPDSIQEDPASPEGKGTAEKSVDQPSSSSPFHHNNLSAAEEEEIRKYIRAETAVLRLGRMNAETDHSSILFNVNLDTGLIEPGQVNSHWYQLGLNKIFTTSWLPAVKDVINHLDPPYPFVAGKTVPDMEEAIRIVTRYWESFVWLFTFDSYS